MIWMVAALMAAVVAFALAAPFLRGRAAGPVAAAVFDRQVYRAQLAEVDRDLARGVVGPEDAARLRVEIGRRLLEADRQSQAQRAPAAAPRPVLAVLALAAVLAGFAVYAWLGRPAMPDAPIADRLAQAQAVYEARPTQAEAEAEARPAAPPANPDPGYAALVAQLRDAVAQRPDDPRGLALLAEHEARLGNLAAARKAQQHLVEVLGTGAKAGDHLQLATLMIEAAGGLITREAEAEIARAIQLDPAEPQARYLEGLLMVQNRRPDRAFPIWRDLLAQDPAAPWAEPIRAVIGDLAWFAGQPDYVPPPAPGTAAPGPDAAAMAAAGAMTEAERAGMIAGMVSQLEARLATEGGTAEEWARLIGALAVQGNRAHAAEILAEARRNFAGRPEGLAAIDAAAARAGLE